MIPKKIHYCWVGGAPKPESVLYCINSWKKFCPDYEIIEWNESNYNFTKNEYMRQAYEAKKWGFVPDYARLDIVYQHGGIYLDTDVELIKSFDDLLVQEAFMGFEETGDGVYYINCGHGFGAVPHNEIILKARNMYENISFFNNDGTLNMIASPHYTTKVLCRCGIIQENCMQEINNLRVYPSEYFCPKNFKTGSLKITKNTYSIHHFTATWLDKKIKDELEYQKKMNAKYGIFLAKKIMYLQSVIKKYNSMEMMKKIPNNIYKKIKKRVIIKIEEYPYYQGIKDAKRYKGGNKNFIILDTAMGSDNTGDQIIMENCEMQIPLYNIENVIHVPTHRVPTKEEFNELSQASYKIVCGTNLLSGNMRTYGLWKLNHVVFPYINCVLMGVGMSSSEEKVDRYTKKLLNTILSKKYIHSVRDSYTENKLKEIGIENVLNTACPTMWNLTRNHCASIPTKKASNVISTITDYNRDEENDKKMLDILIRLYDKVYLWLQGKNDLEYIQKIGYTEKICLIDSALEEYDKILQLENLDYVGTRLHAGIRALSKGHRTIIISIDNRAKCIAIDTNLPIIDREDINLYLEDFINSSFKTDIILPIDNINKWKEQFKKDVT